MIRHHYLLDIGAVEFESALPDGVSSRLATDDDLDDLAHLMLDAYEGTIDYDGEGIEEAVAEVRGYFAGRPSPTAPCCCSLTAGSPPLVSSVTTTTVPSWAT